MLEAKADVMASVNALQAGAAGAVAKIDLVYANNGVIPDDDEPPWVREWRAWAAGRRLPFREALPMEEQSP